MSREQQTRSHDRATDDKGHETKPSHEQPPVAMVRQLLARGQWDPQRVADVIAAHPRATQEIFILLQRTAGNGFAGQVSALLTSSGGLGQPRDIATMDASSDFLEERATIEGPPKAAPVDDRFSEYQESRATIDHPHTTAKDEAPWIERARVFNHAHADNVRAFLESTGTACIDAATGDPDPNKVARWQADHRLPPDGRIGDQTVAAAVSNPSRAL
jgi:hypothetical protein